MQKKALILGGGISGKGAFSLLKKLGIDAKIADRKEGDFKDDPSLDLSPFSLLVISPGIDLRHPLIEKAKKMGIEVISEVELALFYLPDQKKIAVTGTNGKTTTVLLLEKICNESGLLAKAVGNVGKSISEYAVHPNPQEILIIELSSFQLELLSQKPYFDAAVILNITPNHLDRHASMQEYIHAKWRIALGLKLEGRLFLGANVIIPDAFSSFKFQTIDPHASSLLTGLDSFSLKNKRAEKENVAAALSLASFLGIDEEKAFMIAKQFQKPDHRIEWVAEIDGVSYYNDSKASNVEAVIHAVSCFEKDLILIAGGVDKKAPYTPWIQAFQNKIKKMIVFATAKEKMEEELKDHFDIEKVETLEKALDLAFVLAKKGDVVLFSPGCSSFDQFKNYEERGNHFKKLVQKRIG